MDVLYFEYGKKYRIVFSEVFYFGLDVGIVYGQWSDDYQMCSEDEFDLDIDRVV